MDEKADERSQALSISLLRPLILLWLAGVTLRLTILALPPVLHSVETEFHLRASDIGVLAAVPSLFFALASIPSAALIGRFGAVQSLLLGLLINALGAASRGFSADKLFLELSTSVMCLGVAIMQPSMPTLVRTWTPTRIGLATATYTCGLLCGEVVPVWWTVAPQLPWAGGGWRALLFQWSLPVLATAFVIALFRPRNRTAPEPQVSRVWPNWRDRSIWKVGTLLGAVNASYFALNGFLPSWLSQAGASAMIRPALLALNVAQVPASLLMMVFLEQLVFRHVCYLIAGLLMLVGSVGVALAPPAFAIAAAALAGFALAGLLTLALALPPLLVTIPEVPRFSAGVFTLSYTIAVLTALLIGILQIKAPNRLTSILPLAAAALAVVAVGVNMDSPAGNQDSSAH